MSYCRNNGIDSDVYVYASAIFAGKLLICTCSSEGNGLTRPEMILHLVNHLRKGDKVPQHTFERLVEEIVEESEERDSSFEERNRYERTSWEERRE